MSILPELIIQQSLVRGIRAFREDERLLGMLFRNVDSQELQTLRESLRNDSIEICINYPDQELKIPYVVIVLKSESESQPFLGDLQQGSADLIEILGQNPFPIETLTGDQTVLGGGSVDTVGMNAPILLRPTLAIGGTATTILAPIETTALIDPYEEQAYVVVMEGTAAGDRRTVTRIEPSIQGTHVTITVSEDFTTVPDTTSVFKLVGESDDATTGEPAKLFAPTDRIERMGSIFKVNYQLDIASSSSEGVIYLYNIVKAIFFVANKLMISQGFLANIKMSGSDLAPMLEGYPTLVYRRALSLEFEYAFDVFREITEPLATSIEVALSVHHPDATDSTGVEVEFGVTSFDTD